MTAFHHAQDRISFAAEGVALAAADAFDFARDRATPLGLSVLAVVAAVIVALSGGGDAGTSSQAATAAVPAATAPTDVSFVEERGFSLSLPSGWTEGAPPDGAAFAASSPDGLAETTLWVEQQGALGFDAFVAQSQASLDEIGDDVRLTDQVAGGSLESRIAELEATVPLDGGASAAYRVTLRAAGPYRYYLATSVQPGAPPQRLGDAELISGSFRPG